MNVLKGNIILNVRSKSQEPRAKSQEPRARAKSQSQGESQSQELRAEIQGALILKMSFSLEHDLLLGYNSL